MKFEIKGRWSGSVLFSLETDSLKLCLEAAVSEGADLKGAYLKGADLKGADLKGADLKGAYLKGADLKGADLKGAYLKGAYLEGAYLEGADLKGAYLKGAYLKGADLKGAYLKGAYLEGAYLEGADLEGAYLEGAYLNDTKADFFKVLDSVPNEVEGLKKALIEGRIDGSVYSGECACLVGTIANVRQCDYKEIGSLIPNAGRPAERWFLMFRPGKNHTPERHGGAKITLKWIEEWQAKMSVELKK